MFGVFAIRDKSRKLRSTKRERGKKKRKESLPLSHMIITSLIIFIMATLIIVRCQFAAYFLYSIIITGWVYPVVSHWAWYCIVTNTTINRYF